MKYELTSSVYSFEDLRNGHFLYVDKTEYLWKLLIPFKAMYFLSRPRRFGKSLTLSTLKAIFQGKKELFKGLAIYDKPYDWKKYPVIHLAMNGRRFDTVEHLENSLCEILLEQARDLHVDLPLTNAVAMFQTLIDNLRSEMPVILLDEYDKPLLDNITSPEIQDFFRLMKSFYSVLKDRTNDLRFVFVTGVTKFCHVSLFSDLNNLTDISMNADYATMLGYTQRELETNFSEWIQETETLQELPHAEYLAEIKNWYDGYRFHGNAESVYNPVSIANFFNRHGEFNNYRFSTGTPSFLFKLMKQQSFNLPEALEKPVPAIFFDAFEIDRLNPKTLLYQTGYLTIGRTVQTPIPYTKVKTTNYELTFPNFEVKNSFNERLLEYYTNIRSDSSLWTIQALIQAVGSGDADGFVKQLRVIFANIPYDMRGKAEQDYQTIIYVIFMMLNIYIEAEHRTNDGRIDLMLAAGDWIYVIEIKLNKTAGEALKQIENKEYALKFQNRGKRIMVIGINFDSEHGQVTDSLKEELPRL